MSTLKEFGDAIESRFGSSQVCMEAAVHAWEEYVNFAQKYYAYAPKGDGEAYANKIRKFNSSYVAPKKAGCISLNDAYVKKN